MTFPWWLFVLYLAKASDFASTELTIGAAGVERNPLLVSRDVRIVSSVAVPLVVELGARRLERDGHPRMARWARVGVIAAWSIAAFHNWRTFERLHARAGPPPI